ncbi:head maturation protease, ClpP-related [Streptomyces griseorubiginosus]|uniref:head maturation protease, ClpP-related n=1 Tax=Streptomyces griseorubiginosus TaxID=67304 RepID=UPI0036E3B9D7
MITMPATVAQLVASQREQASKQREALGIEARSWYRITNAADSDEAEVMLYDEIGGWFGSTADELIAELRGITAPRMRVRINSPGGSVFEGIAIANALRAHPANVTVQVDALAASIASVIAMSGDRIEMAPNSMMMIHDASGLCMGNATDMEEMAELLDLISDNIADAYAARAGGTRDEWRARMRAETWYLPEDAVENGLADEALVAPKAGQPAEEPDEEDEPDMARPFDLAAYGYNGPTPPASEPEQVTLTFNVGETFGEQLAAMLRKTAALRQEPSATADEPIPEPPAESEPEPVAELPAEPEPEATELAEEPDTWAAAVARLAQPQDPWAAAVARFTRNTSASSAATNAA